jgi:hypothetical protein
MSTTLSSRPVSLKATMRLVKRLMEMITNPKESLSRKMAKPSVN